MTKFGSNGIGIMLVAAIYFKTFTAASQAQSNLLSALAVITLLCMAKELQKDKI